jgi:hypothetical protein
MSMWGTRGKEKQTTALSTHKNTITHNPSLSHRQYSLTTSNFSFNTSKCTMDTKSVDLSGNLHRLQI